MSGDSAMGSLRLQYIIRGDEAGGHETERPVALGHDIALYVSIVVLARPYEPAAGFDGLGDHVVDESVLIPDAFSFEVCFVLFVINFLEDVLESTIVFLQDGVLGGEIARVGPVQGVLEAGMGEGGDGFISVVHSHQYSWGGEVEDLMGFRGSSFRSEDYFELSGRYY